MKDKSEAPKAGRGLKRWLPTALVLALTGGILLWLLLTAQRGAGYSPTRLESDNVSVEQAEVLNISYDTVEPDPYSPDGVEKGNQRALVRLLTGAHAGDTGEIYYMIGYFVGPKLQVGDKIAVLQILKELGVNV